VLLWSALGYFVYGGLGGALAIIILYFLYAFCIFLAVIPFAGVAIQYFVSVRLVNPWVFSLTGIGSTWLTAVMLWVDVAVGALLTSATSLRVVCRLLKRLG
jgi:hypothetical protein